MSMLGEQQGTNPHQDQDQHQHLQEPPLGLTSDRGWQWRVTPLITIIFKLSLNVIKDRLTS